METKKFELRKLLKDRKFWAASFLIAWAAALQGHMMWLKRQDSFKQKFGTITPDRNVRDQEELTENKQSTTDSTSVIFEETWRAVYTVRGSESYKGWDVSEVKT